jgi:hypothetical protein
MNLDKEPQIETLRGSEVTRRQFLELAAGTSQFAGLPENARPEEAKGEVPHRTLGRTGEKVSAIGWADITLARRNSRNQMPFESSARA